MQAPEIMPIIVQEKLLLPERNALQIALIKEFCEIMAMQNSEEKHACVLGWIEKYADNLDQLDNQLTERYRQAKEEDREAILEEIQAALDRLNEING